MARARALQHRAGVLRALGGAARCPQAHGHPRARRGFGRERPFLSRTANPRQCAEPYALAPGRAAWRPGRGGHAAALRNGRGLHGDLPARRRGHAAVDAVRPRRAGIPAQGQRRRRGDLRRKFDRQHAGRARAMPRVANADRRRRGRHPRRPGLRGGAGAPAHRLHAGADEGRRGRGADLHQRHHRPAQGCADSAPGADRQPAGIRVQPELVRLRRQGQQRSERRLLVARRLGLDRRPDGRAAAHAVLRPARSSRTRGASAPSWPSR